MVFNAVNTIKCLTLLEFPLNEQLTVDSVRSQYRKLCIIYHPDQSNVRYKDGEKFKELKEAQEYLTENIVAVNRQIATNFSASSSSGYSNDYVRHQEEARRRAEAEAAKWKQEAEEAKRKAENSSKGNASYSNSKSSYDNIIWLPNHKIKVQQTTTPKKMTGTRFATVLGENRFSTPFEVWCAITHTYEAPFEDNVHTKAGRITEPKQIEFVRPRFRLDIVRPADIWGDGYFSKTYGDFYHDTPIFGGMWDYLLQANGKTVAVFEMKTTNVKNRPYWDRSVPENYALQAALYAYLLHVDQVYMVATFLSDSDYDNLEAFKCNNANTSVYPFKVSERYPYFKQEYIEPAEKWWRLHVETGISPEYDIYKDCKIINALKNG